VFALVDEMERWRRTRRSRHSVIERTRSRGAVRPPRRRLRTARATAVAVWSSPMRASRDSIPGGRDGADLITSDEAAWACRRSHLAPYGLPPGGA
jgi:hypothetical protein